MSENTMQFKKDEWDLPIPSPTPGESNMTCLVEGAEVTFVYEGGESRTVKFKKGSVVKSTIKERGFTNSWNSDDELLDTTTR